MTNWSITEPKENKLSDQFIRISVEIAGNAPRFGRPEVGIWVRDSESQNSFLARVPSVGDLLMRFATKWNGAGTFAFLVTLKKDERCETCRRRIQVRRT